jgi:glycosyltransferase involved in cell wall biosynthesis
MDVSVIIPNYNYARYMRDCLFSVFGSYLESDRMEVVLVDDASTDESVALARDLAFHQGREIRIVRHEVNRGLVETRNTGIQAASGRFLFFLDSDNRLTPGCLREHLDVMLSDPGIDACYAPIQDFSDETGEFQSTRSDAPFDYARLLSGNYIDGMAMYRADVFKRIGGFDAQMPLLGWEDYEYWLRLGSKGHRVEFIPGPPLSQYRVHGSSMTEKVTKLHQHTLRKYLDGIYQLNFRVESDG